LLSAPGSNANSLNRYTLDSTVSIIDLIGVGVGNIVAHEAAHIFGNFHTTRFNSTPRLIDEGGSLNNFVGLVGSTWGDGDEIDVDFGIDQYSTTEGFTGFEDSMATIAYGLATAVDPALVGPSVSSITPPSGPQGSTTISEIVVKFSEALDPLTAADPLNFRLIGAGANGILDGGVGDDVIIAMAPVYDGEQTVQLAIDESLAPLARGAYQLTISSKIKDASGNALNSRSGPAAGSDHVHTFSVVATGVEGDLFQVVLQTGQRIVVNTRTPWDDAAGLPLNDLRPHLSLFNPAGTPVANDVGSLDGKNSRLDFTTPVAGVFTLQIGAQAGSGEYELTIELETVSPDRLADFDHDQDADGGDFLAWQRGFGLPSEAQKSNGDADGDQDVDADDLTIWTALFGTGAHSEGSLEPAQMSAAASAADIGIFDAVKSGKPAATFRSTPIQSALPTSSIDFWTHSDGDGVRSRLYGTATLSRARSQFSGIEFTRRFAQHELDRWLTAVDNALDSLSEVRREPSTTQLLDLDSIEERSREELLVDESIVDYQLSSELADVFLHRRG
jgi:hypothetical protein